MEILFWCCGIVWLIGWVNEVATIHAGIKKHKIDHPVKHLMPIMLLFSWPYFYFYGKALQPKQ